MRGLRQLFKYVRCIRPRLERASIWCWWWLCCALQSRANANGLPSALAGREGVGVELSRVESRRLLTPWPVGFWLERKEECKRLARARRAEMKSNRGRHPNRIMAAFQV